MITLDDTISYRRIGPSSSSGSIARQGIQFSPVTPVVRFSHPSLEMHPQARHSYSGYSEIA